MKKLVKKLAARLFTRERIEVLKASAKSQKGFNLIEIMVAITIIGILMAIVGVNVLETLESAKADATKTQMGNIQQALIMYKLDNGRFPTTTEGLGALVKAPSGVKKAGKSYLPSEPKDGWDQAFQYYSPGTHGSNDYEIISLGADGQEGGEGNDADINSWENQ